jgi:hypothetical protein
MIKPGHHSFGSNILRIDQKNKVATFMVYSSISKIYDTHPIFSNFGASEKLDLTCKMIDEICDYFSIWQNDIIHYKIILD